MPYTLQTFKAEFFKALSHPARIRLLEALREGEQSVTQLQASLGMDQSAVSQQLAVLRGKGLLRANKVGTSVFYCAADPLLYELLDVARAIFNNQLIETSDVLRQLTQEPETSALAGRESVNAGLAPRVGPERNERSS